jgi:hypothetical protein
MIFVSSTFLVSALGVLADRIVASQVLRVYSGAICGRIPNLQTKILDRDVEDVVLPRGPTK